MKHFVVYTVLRLALFLATAGVLVPLALLVFGEDPVVWLLAVAAAGLVSSVLSLKYLAGPRERFAQSVQARADRASAKLEEMRSREDTE